MSDESLQTRCPACQTVFAVEAVDLDRASGRVRCGDCMQIFDARAHALKPDDTDSGTLETSTRKPLALDESVFDDDVDDVLFTQTNWLVLGDDATPTSEDAPDTPDATDAVAPDEDAPSDDAADDDDIDLADLADEVEASDDDDVDLAEAVDAAADAGPPTAEAPATDTDVEATSEQTPDEASDETPVVAAEPSSDDADLEALVIEAADRSGTHEAPADDGFRFGDDTPPETLEAELSAIVGEPVDVDDDEPSAAHGDIDEATEDVNADGVAAAAPGAEPDAGDESWDDLLGELDDEASAVEATIDSAAVDPRDVARTPPRRSKASTR